jgi:exoribonuclease R
MSVLWELTPDLKIIPEKTWMGRALIRTAHALTYYQAQRMLDGKAADVDGAHVRPTQAPCLLARYHNIMQNPGFTPVLWWA